MTTLSKLDDLTAALAQLKTGLAQIQNDLDRDGVIQRFEFTFEMAWKVLQEYAQFQGLPVASPREAFRMAADFRLIDNPNIWFAFIKDRNRTTHLYSEKEAKEVIKNIPKFVTETEKLLTILLAKLKQA